MNHLIYYLIFFTPVVLLTGDPHIKSSAYRSICLHDTNMATLYTILPLTLLLDICITIDDADVER